MRGVLPSPCSGNLALRGRDSCAEDHYRMGGSHGFQEDSFVMAGTEVHGHNGAPCRSRGLRPRRNNGAHANGDSYSYYRTVANTHCGRCGHTDGSTEGSGDANAHGDASTDGYTHRPAEQGRRVGAEW